MENTFKYNNEAERESILNDNKDKHLVEEANITEGNFLIFSDEPRKPEVYIETITIPKSEYEELQNQLLLSENKNVEGGIF